MNASFNSTDSKTKSQKWAGKSVLIVEDNMDNFLFLKILLSGYGLELLHASTAKETMSMFHEHPQISLVLMDIQLPDDSGLNLTTALKKLRPDLPIVAQTAFAMVEDREECLNAGCDDYISKPLNSKMLLKLMDTYLS